MINIRQRRQQISTALCEPGRRSLRAIGAVLGISKSSVHRHQAAIAQRQQFPESALWETAAGEQWLNPNFSHNFDERVKSHFLQK